MSTSTNIERISQIKTIKIKVNSYVKCLSKEIFQRIKKEKFKLKDLSKELGIKYITFWEYFHKKESIPYYILLYLTKKLKLKLDYNNILFETGSRRNLVSLPTKLDERLAFIIGAHLADGHMRERSNVWKNNLNAKHYEIVLREEYESNVKYFTQIFNSIFKTNIKYKFNKNHYEFYISNKTIYYFFKLCLDIPSGRKTEIVEVPKYIFNEDNEIKKSFLKGIFMFDGSINYVDAGFCLISKSKKLIEQISCILNNLNIPADYICLTPDKFNRYKIYIRKIEKLKRIMPLFEENTEKWYRLNEHFYGFGNLEYLNTNQNIKKLIIQLDKFYPRKRKSSKNFSDILRIIYSLKEANLENIAKSFQRNNKITYNYLRKLEKWKILKRKSLNNAYWVFNTKLPIIDRKNIQWRQIN